MTARWLASPKPVADVRPNPNLKFTCWCGDVQNVPFNAAHQHVKGES